MTAVLERIADALERIAKATERISREMTSVGGYLFALVKRDEIRRDEDRP